MELLLEKLGNQTKQDDSVKKALLVIAASDGMSLHHSTPSSQDLLLFKIFWSGIEPLSTWARARYVTTPPHLIWWNQNPSSLLG